MAGREAESMNSIAHISIVACVLCSKRRNNDDIRVICEYSVERKKNLLLRGAGYLHPAVYFGGRSVFVCVNVCVPMEKTVHTIVSMRMSNAHNTKIEFLSYIRNEIILL